MHISLQTGGSVWMSRAGAALLAAMLGASLVYWALRWNSASTALGDPAVLVVPVDAPGTSAAGKVDADALARLLGSTDGAVSDQAAAKTPGNYALVGVVANGPGRGTALISVDGQAARAVRVGARVDDKAVLLEVARKSVVLGTDAHGGARWTLQISSPNPVPDAH